MAKKKGLFIVVDGIDGSGKTTLGQQLAEELDGVFLSSLGEGPISAAIRHRRLISDKDQNSVMNMQSMLVAHSETYLDYIAPITKKGRHVVVDRWLWSTYAYNVHKRPDNQTQELLFREALKPQSVLSNLPDISIYCKISQEVANARLLARGNSKSDNLDKVSEERKERILDGFEAMTYFVTDNDYSVALRNNGKTQIIVNAELSTSQVFAQAIRAISEHL